jgi:branched-chain amino acid transport system permease protein
VVLGAVALSVFNTYLMPTVLRDVPGIVGLDFNFALLSSGIYGFLLVFLMLLRPEGLVPDGVRRRGG